MPTIAEGKYYPRRTLEYVWTMVFWTMDRTLTVSRAEEVRELLEDQASDSPDLGPYPIARLEDTTARSISVGNEAARNMAICNHECAAAAAAAAATIEPRQDARNVYTTSTYRGVRPYLTSLESVYADGRSKTQPQT